MTGRLNIDLCGAVAPRKSLRGRQAIFSHVKPHQRAGKVVHGPLARRSALARCYKQGAGHDRFYQHDPPFRDGRVTSAVVVKFHFNPLKDFLVEASARFPLLRPVGCETLNRTVDIRLNAKEK